MASLEECLSHLKIKRGHLLKLEKYLSRCKSLNKEEEGAYSKELDSILKFISSKPWQGISKISENTSEDKYRYLCISDGFTICCLDLKQSTDNSSSGFQKVPSKISTLSLPQKRLPFALSLFNFGSCAYVVGGHEFAGVKDSDLLDSINHPSDFDFYTFLLERCTDESGASCSKPYLLTLDEGSLCLSECRNIGPLNIPTFWPLVEQLDGRLHVIESLPSLRRGEIMHSGYYNHIPSHEVLVLSESGEGSDFQIDFSSLLRSGIGSHTYIHKYLVVGHRIYALERYIGHRFVVFDSETNKWESRVRPQCKSSMVQITHVTEILDFGFGRCIGKLEFRGAPEPLYVVLAIGTMTYMAGAVAVAYLVTTKGQVLCCQRLNHIFMGFKDPFFMRPEGTIISCEQGRNETCVVVRGYDNIESLFITTFTWELARGALVLVSDLCAQIRDEEEDLDKLPFIDEEDFMNIRVKGWYTSQLGTGLEPVSGMKPILPRLSACFL